MKDPIVEEVRKQRMEHTLKIKGDLSAICADLRHVQIASAQSAPSCSEKIGANKVLQRTC